MITHPSQKLLFYNHQKNTTMKVIASTAIILLVFSFDSTAQVLENKSITNTTLTCSSFVSDNEGFAAGENGMLFRTGNGGITWDSIASAKKFIRLEFADVLVGYALGENAAYKTIDGGFNWTTLTLPGYIGKAIWFQSSTTGFISGYQMIFKTTDGGQSWTTVYTEDVSFLDFYFMNESSGVATAHDGANRCLWRTNDGGESWINVFDEQNYFMNTVWFTDELTGFAAGYFDQIGLGKEPAILKTADGGLTWTEKFRYKDITGRGEAFTEIRFKNSLNGYAISRHNYDAFTVDGGETWQLMSDSQELSETPVYGLYKSLDGVNDLYLIGRDGTVTVWK
jgi:photosystem II stability/assembly factor-like uncharacterized protein